MLKEKRILRLAFSSNFPPSFIIGEGERYVGLYLDNNTRMIVNKTEIEHIADYSEETGRYFNKRAYQGSAVVNAN